ncbi:S-layer homology domain-containing protein [Pseudoflavonifractor sp.]|jgi:hypothetical protein|uniref:S-layer homology domain-containing protein n=1 Tax=Pseudoflavonifractor sp. TaxID=1980281 RepID=UPI003D9215E4
MRNLKRVLSLALASVMLLGMMVIGAGAADKTAADLTDMDQVTNKEAVSLMVDLGIIVGKPDGSFAPSEGVDRATMAKLITYILMGDVDAAIFEGTKTDLTDIDTNWAEGYIKYCYANGIISGDGLGHFFPTQGVTVVQAAKMLLVALGYDANASKYQGDSMWSVNIMKDAQAAGLINNMSVKATDTLTRDGAAQMIYNALFAKTVTPEFQYDMGVQYLSKYVSAATTLGQQVYGLAKVEALVSNIPANGDATLTALSGATAAEIAAVNAANAAKFAVSPDQAGTKVAFYTKNDVNVNNGVVTLTYKSLYSTSLTAASTVVLATANTGINLTNATTSSHKDFLAAVEMGTSNPDIYSFVNGVQKTVPNAAAGTAFNSDVTTAAAKKGAIVEFIDSNNNGKADIIKVTEKKVATLTAAPSTKVVGDATQVKVPGVINAFSAANTTETVKGYADLKKGDVVLYVQIGKVTYIEKAASVSGVVSGLHSTKGLLLDGTYYLTSDLTNASNSWSKDYTNTYTFYLDNANNIVKAVKDTDKATDNSYAVVLDTAWVDGTGALGESKYAQAQLLKDDGTTEIVTISKLGGKTIVKDTAAVGGDTSNKTELSNVVKDAFYTYSVDSNGKYELTAVTADATASTATEIKNGNANLTVRGGASKGVASANTIFLVKTTGTDGKAVYTAYKGINEVPSMSGATMKVVVKNGIASYVYVSAAGTLTGTVGDIVYFTGSSIETTYVPKNGDVPAHYVVNAIVNGEATTLKLDVTAFDTNKLVNNSSAPVVRTFYTVAAKDANGIVSKVTVTSTTNGINVSGGTLVSGATVKTVNADTAIYYIGTDDAVNTLSFDAVTADATDVVTVIDANNDGMAEIVYIKQVLSNTATASAIKYTIDGANETYASSTSGTVAEAPAKATEGKTVAISEVTVAPGATYVVSGTAVVQNNGSQAGPANTITITVTAEDGTSTSTITLTFVAAAV